MSTVWFITHPEVSIEPSVPVTQWGLSPLGRQRMQALLAQPWIRGIGAVWCSTERKAIEGAQIVAAAIGAVPHQHPNLGENDRSATGYLPKAEFEATADAFFANPHRSIRGWETAADAQRRIVAAIATVLSITPSALDIAIVAHGGVGALLLCHLKGCAISRTQDQPGAGGGNYYCFDRGTYALRHDWRPIEQQDAMARPITRTN
jgi:broad specificity phosphatase PhoE